MRSDIFLAIVVSMFITAAGCQGGGSSSNDGSSPLKVTIAGLACPAYALPVRTSASSADFADADMIRSVCKVVLTWWHTLPSQTWCPYLRQGSSVEYCGPYDNWGFISSVDNPGAFNLGGDIFHDLILPDHPDWILRDAGGGVVTNNFISSETAPDHGNMGFVDFYFNFFIEVPSSVAGGRWKGTYKDRSWNLRFLDNFIVYLPAAWSSRPVNPDTGDVLSREDREQDILDATKRLRQRADNEAGGLRYIANVWNDVEASYLDRDIYPELMQYVDYALFEVWTSNLEGVPVSEEIWLRRVTAAQDMVENRNAEPVVQAGVGDFWYALSSLLLVSKKGKGMIWSNKMYSDALIQQLSALDLGEALDLFFFADNAYQREWEKGKVIVNPSDDATLEFLLDESYRDAATGETVTSVTLPPKSGKILLIP
jgi:hypothetical protein